MYTSAFMYRVYGKLLYLLAYESIWDKPDSVGMDWLDFYRFQGGQCAAFNVVTEDTVEWDYSLDLVLCAKHAGASVEWAYWDDLFRDWVVLAGYFKYKHDDTTLTILSRDVTRTNYGPKVERAGYLGDAWDLRMLASEQEQ